MNLPAGWKSPCLLSSFPARTTWHWFAKSSSWILERKRNAPLQEDYMLLSSRPVWESLGLTGCCNAHYPFTLPALCSILPSVNFLNEPSGIFFGQDPSLLPELGSACWTPGIVWAMVKTSVYHRKARTTEPLCHLRHAFALLLKALPLHLPWNWWMIALREGRQRKNLLQSN